MSALGDHKKTLIHSAAFLCITAALYYPVVSNVRRFVAGTLDDSYTILWLLWQVRHTIFALDKSLSYSSFIESPFGLEVTHSTIMNHLFALPFTWALGPVGSYNVMILSSFFLSALGMYLLVNEVTGCRAAAFFSGLAFSFSPFHTAFSATGGMDASQMQYMPLTLLFLVRHERSGALKDLFLFILFLLLSVFSFGYYGAIIFAAVAAYCSYTMVLPRALFLFRDNRDPGLKRILLWGTGSYLFFVLAYNSFELLAGPLKSLVWLVPAAYAVSFAAGKEGGGRVFFKDLYEKFKGTDPRRRYMAIGGVAAFAVLVGIFLMPVFHPNIREISSSYFVPAYSYFVPPPDHQILGSFLPSFFIPQKDPIVGKMVHIGLVLTGLMTFAAVKTFKAAERDRVREAFLVVFFTGTALALPPAVKFGEFTLWGPVYSLHALVPPFVDIRRVVVLMLLAGAVLAGFGIKEILKMTSSRPAKGALYIGLLAVLAVEFYPALDFKDTARLPGAYSWLRDEPGDFTVAEYPLTSIYDSKRNEPFFGQTVHGKRLLNPLGAVGHDPAPSNGALKTYIDKGGPANEIYSNTGNAASALSYLGVKYILLRTDKVGDGVLFEMGSWLKEAASFPDSKIYAVTAPPADAFLSFKDFYRNGFFLNYSEKTDNGYVIKNPYYRPPESVYANRAWLWMGKNASVRLTGLKNTEGLYDLTFTARSHSTAARLSVKDRGAVVYSATVEPAPGVFTIKGIRLGALEVRVLEFEIENDGALKAARGFLDPRAKDEPISYIGIAIRDAVIKEEAVKDKPAALISPGMLDGLYGEGRI
jgi:hypothetical protein